MADPRLMALKAAFDAYVAKVTAYVTWAEGFKNTVTQQVADAVKADDAEEDVDIAALGNAIMAAGASVPETPAAPPFDPSANA